LISLFKASKHRPLCTALIDKFQKVLDDNMFMDYAIAGNVKYVVRNDKHSLFLSN